MAKKVFVSYSRRDGAAVETLVNDLRSLGHDPWVDRQLVGGQLWWDEVLRHIELCDVFLVALSPDMVNSMACEAEYGYAAALGKPMLPVTVRPGVADELLPQAIGMVQRVDYTTQDKQAFAALLGGLGGLPDAPPPPAAMPPRPTVPLTYLYDLKQEIDSGVPLSAEKQAQIVHQLVVRLNDGTDPSAMKELLDRFQRRDDLLVRTAQQITDMRASLQGQGGRPFAPQAPAPPPTPQPATTSPAPPPQTDVPPPPPPGPIYHPPMPVAAPSSSVSGAWWLLPIFMGLIGGLIAWAALKERAPKTARNMLIVGVVISVLAIAALSSDGGA